MTDGRNSVMETAKVYYPYLDVLKGIAIILMVMGHVIPWTLDKSFIHQPLLSLSGNELYLSLVYKIIYSFHMPLLFFVSGFLFYKPIKINDKFFQKTLTKRINRILIPYFFTGSLLLVSRGHWGYWFLQCLFFMDLLVAALMLITNKYHLNHKKEFILYSVVGAFLYAFGKVFSSLEDETLGIVVIGRLFMYYPAFVLGFFMNKYMKLKEFFMNRYIVFSSFILYIITFILCGTKIPIVGFISSVLLPLTMIIYLYHLCCNKFKSGGGNSIYW